MDILRFRFAAIATGATLFVSVIAMAQVRLQFEIADVHAVAQLPNSVMPVASFMLGDTRFRLQL